MRYKTMELEFFLHACYFSNFCIQATVAAEERVRMQALADSDRLLTTIRDRVQQERSIWLREETERQTKERARVHRSWQVSQVFAGAKYTHYTH